MGAAALMLALAAAQDFAALFNAGLDHYSAKRYGEAAPLLEQAARLNPKDFNVHYVLGAAYSQLGHVDDALRQWRAAAAIDGKRVKLLQVMAVEYSKGRYFQEAAETARQALRLDATQPNLYFLAIKAFQDSGDTDSAAALAAEAVERFPDSARAHFEHGFHLQKRGAAEQAIQQLEAAMKLDGAYEEPPFFLADLLVKQGRNEEALPLLRKALENRPDYVPARVLLGRALMNLERWKEAIQELEETVRQSPDHPQPHLLLSQIWFRLGDEVKAKTEKELSLKLRRQNPALLEAVQGRPFR